MNSKENYLRSVSDAHKRQRKLREINLRKRIELFAQCESDPAFRAATLNILYATPQPGESQTEATIRGCLFYFQYFAWTYDPRPRPEDRIIPLLLYAEYQPDIVRHIITQIESTVGDTIDRADTLFEKSRDMGLSWIIYQIAIYYLIFRSGNILVGSNTAADLDKIGDLGTPFEKMRLQMRQLYSLTPWVLPAHFNPKTDMPECIIRLGEGRQILGKPSTANFGRGPRATFIILDEYQSWENAYPAFTSCTMTSNARFIIGTPLGPHNHYARMARGEADEKVYVYRVHWTLHPLKAAGLTNDADGRPTSPWYREQTDKLSPEQVASEIDIKYDTSTRARIFTDFLDLHRVKNLKPIPGSRIIRVWDPGRTFAVLFMQVDKHLRVLCLREEIFEFAELHTVAQEIIQISNEFYPEFEFDDCGDPAGANTVNSAQEAPEYQILTDYEINVDYFYVQDMPPRMRVKSRIQSIHNKLRELCTVPGLAGPSFLVDEQRCPKLVEALSEKYRWKIDRVTKKPLDVVDEVHPWEDVVDCLGYGMLYKFGVTGTGGISNRRVEVEKGTVSWKRSGMTRRRY